MNRFPLCAVEKSLSFVIESQTISCPIKAHDTRYIQNDRGVGVGGGRRLHLTYCPAGGCLHLQISLERCCAPSGRLCLTLSFRKSSALSNRNVESAALWSPCRCVGHVSPLRSELEASLRSFGDIGACDLHCFPEL